MGNPHFGKGVVGAPLRHLLSVLTANDAVNMTGYEVVPLRRREKEGVKLVRREHTHQLNTSSSFKHVLGPYCK